MKKTWYLLLSVVILGLVIWLVKKPGNSSLSKEYQFAVLDVNKIHSIQISDNNGTVIQLSREKKKWKYGDQYDARPDAIKNLLDAITRVELQFIPRQAAIPGMNSDLVAHGIHVQIFNRAGGLLKAYKVGGTTPDERGTYMKMDGADAPVVTHIPGWEGALRNRYWMRPVEWRDRMIFQEALDNIKSVSVNYPKQRAASFHIESNTNGYTIKPYYDTTTSIDRPIKPGAFEAYLRGFSSVGAESIIEDRILYDSLKMIVPFAIITLESKSNKTEAVSLYPIIPENMDSPRSSIQRYHALNRQEGVFIVQQLLFKKLFWGYDFFFHEDM
jgi:hypothetical protein